MADPDVTPKGILERNSPGLGHLTGYRLDDATIEVDLSEIPAVDESLVGMPMNLEGHFETREHPELGASPYFKAHRANPGAFSDAGDRRPRLRLQLKAVIRRRVASIRFGSRESQGPFSRLPTDDLPIGLVLYENRCRAIRGL